MWSIPRLQLEAVSVPFLLPLKKSLPAASFRGWTPPFPLLHFCRQVYNHILLLLPRPPHRCEGGGNYWGGGGQSFPPIGIQRRGGHIFQTLLGLLFVLFLLVFRLLLLQRRGGYFRTLLLLLVLLLPLLPSLKFSRKNDYNSDGTYMTGADGCFQRF